MASWSVVNETRTHETLGKIAVMTARVLLQKLPNVKSFSVKCNCTLHNVLGTSSWRCQHCNNKKQVKVLNHRFESAMRFISVFLVISKSIWNSRSDNTLMCQVAILSNDQSKWSKGVCGVYVVEYNSSFFLKDPTIAEPTSWSFKGYAPLWLLWQEVPFKFLFNIVDEWKPEFFI